MPWRGIYFIIIITAFSLFALFNLNNTCDVSIIFYTVKNIPVYLITLFSFLIGTILVLPFFIQHKNKKEKSETPYTYTGTNLNEVQTVNLKNNKTGFFGKFKKKNKTIKTEQPVNEK